MTAEPATSFESFVAARSSALFGTAVLLTGDRHVAEDLLQTARRSRDPTTRERVGGRS